MTRTELTISEKILNTMSGKEGQVFKRQEVIQMVIKNYPGTNESSVIPSDYCYNIINNGITFNLETRWFELATRGTYKFLGPNAKYSGIVYWRGSAYGEWKQGKYRQL